MAPKQATGGLTAREFFGLGIKGCGVSDASYGARVSYPTVARIAAGRGEPLASTLRRLEDWSRTQPAAQARGVWISATRTLNLRPN